MTTNRDSLIEKIKALLSKTVERGCSEAEAMTALEKACALRDAYEITDDELRLTKEQVAILRGEPSGSPDPHDIKRSLCGSVAEFCGCKGWRESQGWGRRQSRIVFCGYPADVRFATWLLDTLLDFVQAELAKHLMSGPYGERRRIINGFVTGICNRINQRLRDLCQQSETVATSNGRELVVVRSTAIVDKMKELGIKLVVDLASRLIPPAIWPDRRLDTAPASAGRCRAIKRPCASEGGHDRRDLARCGAGLPAADLHPCRRTAHDQARGQSLDREDDGIAGDPRATDRPRDRHGFPPQAFRFGQHLERKIVSTGLGRLQRKLLAILRSGEWHDTTDLVTAAHRLRPGLTITARPSASQLRSTRRALAGLQRAGHVFRWPGRPVRWTSNRDRYLADVIRNGHYLHSVPTRPVLYFNHDGAVVCFASPAGRNVNEWLLGKPNAVLELARMWAPDDHRPNLLTEALAAAIRELRQQHPQCEALISYADPAAGHNGGVYRAASWVPVGTTDRDRQYRDAQGRIVRRRQGHRGKIPARKADALAAGLAADDALPGKIRFGRGLTRKARRAIARRANGQAGAAP